jgi:hypothetical protein
MMLIPKGRPWQPGTWYILQNKSGTEKHVCFTCPNGHHGYLDHDIAPDGTVSLSVECMQERCTFHENIKLEGWDLEKSFHADLPD